ncbi:MAG: hypothetical protein VR69_02535 [Peptococcaceae bacterium BRH_c4b]|nr:MAG: hypothetical protein VR69_02535 [Peptococcaceae bacterium BRH_c4b]
MVSTQACRCLVCNRERKNLNFGLVIKGNYICYWCEQAIVESGCGDESYNDYVNGVRKIWRCPVA